VNDNLEMSQRAAIQAGTDTREYRYIEFTKPAVNKPESDFRCLFTLSLGDEQWSVDLVMMDAYTQDLVGFWEELARFVGGWLEPKQWRSQDAEVEIVAAHEGERGTATLDVRMRWPPELRT
jgi:hypothetical protein